MNAASVTNPGEPAHEVLDQSRAGDGRQAILKVETADGPVIVKRYGRKQGQLRQAVRAAGCRLIGKSSPTVEGRWQTEAEVLARWHEEGFDVPRLLDLRFPALGPEPYLVMEYIEGPTVWHALQRRQRPLRERTDLLARFAVEWCRRHDRAEEMGDRRLIQLRAGFHHVLVCGERLVHFDFESVYTHHPVERLISLEIMGYLQTLAAVAGMEFPDLLPALIDAYPDRQRLQRVRRDTSRGTMTVLKPFRKLHMRYEGDSAKGKLQVGRALRETLRELERGD